VSARAQRITKGTKNTIGTKSHYLTGK